jgi:anti-sigma factor (TIGR02949 family)
MPTSKHGTIDCEAALRRLAELLDGELDEAPRSAVEHHIDTCRSCYSRAEFERKLKSRLRELRDEPVDPAFENHIGEIARGFTSS